QDVGDPAKPLRGDIGVGGGFDLSGGGYLGDQRFHLGHFGRLYGDLPFLRLVNAEPDNTPQRGRATERTRAPLPFRHALPLNVRCSPLAGGTNTLSVFLSFSCRSLIRLQDLKCFAAGAAIDFHSSKNSTGSTAPRSGSLCSLILSRSSSKEKVCAL